MIKKLILLITLVAQLQNIVANNQNIVGEIPLYERISIKVNKTYAFDKICTLVSKESMQEFNDLLKDYCRYIVTLPDFNNLFNNYGELYKAYRDFTKKPLTLTIHFGFNEIIDFDKKDTNVYLFKKSLTISQKEQFKKAMQELKVILNKLLHPNQFFTRTRELRNKIGLELKKCNISMNDVVTGISLF